MSGLKMSECLQLYNTERPHLVLRTQSRMEFLTKTSAAGPKSLAGFTLPPSAASNLDARSPYRSGWKAKGQYDVTKLGRGLRSESQQNLDVEFDWTVVPNHLNGSFFDARTRDVLHQHAKAFTDWG